MKLKFLFAILVYFLTLSDIEALRQVTCFDNPCVYGKCIDMSKTITNWSKYLCECEVGWSGENCDEIEGPKANAIILNKIDVFSQDNDCTDCEFMEKVETLVRKNFSWFVAISIGILLFIVFLIFLVILFIKRTKKERRTKRIKKRPSNDAYCNLNIDQDGQSSEC